MQLAQHHSPAHKFHEVARLKTFFQRLFSLEMIMTTDYSISDERSINMPNIDADLIIQRTEKHLPEEYDEQLRALFELGGSMNVIILDELSNSAFMTFYNASQSALGAYRNRGPQDDGKIAGWFERVCEEWDELLNLMRSDPRFQSADE